MNVHTNEIQALNAALAHRAAQSASNVELFQALGAARDQVATVQAHVSEIERTLGAFTAAGASASQHSEQERDAIAQVTACRKKLLQANTSLEFARARELAIETKLDKAADVLKLAERAAVNAEKSLRNAEMISEAHQCIALQEKLKLKLDRLRAISFRDGLNTPLCELGDPVPQIVEQVLAQVTARNDRNTPMNFLRASGALDDATWVKRLAELMASSDSPNGAAA